MSTLKLSKPFILVAMMALALLATACGSSAEKFNNDGNEKFAEDLYMEALATYQNAQIESPELAEPYYNAANAFYREGAYEQALEQMITALQFADEESLAESSFYNLGNSLFNSRDLESAIAAYTEALLINPDDQDAKYNLELAMLQQEQQEQQEQEQQEQEQEQQDQEQEQDQENQDQQESESGDQGEEQQEENQDQKEQEGENGEEEEQDGEGQPQDGQEEGEQPGQMPPPGQSMTEEQAEQLLEAAAQEGKTLQGELGQIYVVPPSPPVQDW